METGLLGVSIFWIYLNLAILFILLIIGVPVPFCFLVSLAIFVYISPLKVAGMLPMGYRNISAVTMLAIPLFILAGGFMSTSGIADRIVEVTNSMVRRFRSGLGASAVVACAFTGAIAGTCSAAMAAIGPIVIPAMEKQGYSRGYSSALVTCASVLGQLIPPSVPMIIYAFVARVSVLACFLSSVGPGILLIIVYIFINRYMVHKMPDVKALPSIGFHRQVREVGSSLRRGIFAILAPIIIYGGIYGGIMTLTEVAAVAVVYALIVGVFVYRKANWGNIYNTLAEASVTSGVILMMIFFVLLASRAQIMLNIPQMVITLFTSVSENKYVILLLVNVFLIVVGMMVDDFTGTLLVTPLLMPLMMHIGVNPIQFAAILGTNLGLGNVTPPVAPILYLGARVGNVSVDKMMKTALIYILFGSFLVVLITTYWPALSLTLPRLLMPRYMMGLG